MLNSHALIFVSWLRLQNRIAYYCSQKRKETKHYFILDSPHHLVLCKDCSFQHRHTEKQICLPKYSLLWFSIYKANAQTKPNFQLFPLCFLKTHSQKRRQCYCIFSFRCNFVNDTPYFHGIIHVSRVELDRDSNPRSVLTIVVLGLTVSTTYNLFSICKFLLFRLASLQIIKAPRACLLSTENPFGGA